MKIYHISFLYKLVGFLRFLIFKLLSNVKCSSFFGLIGSRNVLIFKRGDSIGDKFITAASVEVISRGSLQVGNNVNINSYSRVVALNRITIGNNVIIAKFVSILDHDHAYELNAEKKLHFDGYEVKSITIGNNVWIGDKVTILKGVKIGDNVIVAANSVVSRSVPPNSIVAGIPAKVIKELK